MVPIRLEMMGITLMSPSATVYNGRHEPLTQKPWGTPVICSPGGRSPAARAFNDLPHDA
ncbi:hypothetical protein BN2475_1480001 [Paraburkholderia ribeironis]|uniref:Uncharacterized protein n=1 Tax=Paraburkholderia ribeironis TaxID=1247936 RepID=A0A1N7SQ38_9BURK|nr:hypothetical protein BN2475_1480001 [Paraburkholderia ribeironis]